MTLLTPLYRALAFIVALLLPIATARGDGYENPSAAQNYINQLLGQPGGLAALNAQGQIAGVAYLAADNHLPRDPASRPPSYADDSTWGWTAGDGVNTFGSLWGYNGTVWQMKSGQQMQAAWLPQKTALPCDAMSTSCLFAYSLYKVKSAPASSNVVQLWWNGTTSAQIQWVGNAADFATADNFCRQATLALPCYVINYTDQITGAVRIAPQGITAITASGGTGWTNNAVLALSCAGGTCSGTGANAMLLAPTVKISASAGVLTGASIQNNGLVIGTPTSGSQTLSGTGAGTGASITVTWGYPQAQKWLPANTSNNFRTVSTAGVPQNSTGQTGGPAPIMQTAALSLLPASIVWTPSSTTIATVGTDVLTNGNRPIITTPDGLGASRATAFHRVGWGRSGRAANAAMASGPTPALLSGSSAGTAAPSSASTTTICISPAARGGGRRAKPMSPAASLDRRQAAATSRSTTRWHSSRSLRRALPTSTC